MLYALVAIIAFAAGFACSGWIIRWTMGDNEEAVIRKYRVRK